MKYKIVKKYASLAIFLFMGLLAASCASNGNGTLKTGEAASSAEETASDDEKTASSDSDTGSADKKTASSDDETDSAYEKTAPGAVSLGNPIKPVDSEKDFAALGLPLSLPENDTWCSRRSYSIINGKVAQIAFYDEITNSDALARAGSEKDGDPSGIYYNFDEKKEETWTAFLADGAPIDITVSVTVDNSDVHGVLAAWTYKGVRYSLWEDSARNQTSEVGKLAIEIAKRADVH